jgi:hypothetical protein
MTMRTRLAVAAVWAFGIALALAVGRSDVKAVPPDCDFLTAGGYILTTAGGTHAEDTANFAVGGGCQSGTPTWGHLQYHDKAIDLKVSGTIITGYMPDAPPDDGVDPQGQPTGTRIICGTAQTNLASPNNVVDFKVRTRDAGEPGTSDKFDITLFTAGGNTIVYTSGADTTLAGGNSQLHKPNPSTGGTLSGTCPPAGGGSGGPQPLTVMLSSANAGSGTVTSNPSGINCSIAANATPTTCTVSFTPQVVTLTATADAGTGPATFNVADCDQGVTNNGTPVAECKVTVTAPGKTVSVIFGFVE